MIKLSKKELKKEAERIEAYYFTGNVYNYENVVYYLQRLVWKTEKGTKTKNKKDIQNIKKELLKNINSNYFTSLQDIVKNIETIKHDNYSMDQLYYSAGLHGNSGQLHEIKLYNKGNINAIYHVYY